MTATHYIAIDNAGLLWGGVPIAAGMSGLKHTVIFEADAAQLKDYDADADGNLTIDGESVWRCCATYEVVLTDDPYEPPAAGARCVYSGHAMGWLPDSRKAAWVLA